MIHCTVTTQAKTDIYANVRNLTIPAFSGQMQILSGHAESFVVLQKGTITVRQVNGPDVLIPVSGGACHVSNDAVIVVC